ncbi:uncharacterized protein MONOS_8443 [Monocercomonoides exilis]|uniref:uncharacterized protein n=1 Tax=Monocercomonoides exilis TaxID=2049356 RepID=UPI003559519C|nr:hypothetical protein MONOS_8443 [Monocercomonoides exilis]|eukprot:MONOS_8443.1-p1 / transcript=MONOS_8443.1 / gene=MONOS_8443 / organism=Monocercomonoides_exilis_PA203 / gene_product=unspecified product / transcript_product=unspecified product / location=Mono_scaffold00318:32175-33028(-) / protein_length=198 / sequence_SO=supercontig / SO=protein_coding / is_pseudo=false
MTTLLEGFALGLRGIFQQSGPTGGMGMVPPISIPTTDAPGSQFPAMLAISSTTKATSTSASSSIPSHSPTQLQLEAAKSRVVKNLNIAALKAARHLCVKVKFGFKAAKTLQEEKDDKLLTTEQLERMNTILQPRTDRKQVSAASSLSQKTRRIGSWRATSTSSGTGRSTRSSSRSNFFRRKEGAAPKPVPRNGRRLE